MSKYDIRKDKPMPSDEEINKYKNFDQVLKKSAIYDYKKATKPLYKNVKFVGVIAVFVAVGLIFLFESDEEHSITIQTNKTDSILTNDSMEHASDTTHAVKGNTTEMHPEQVITDRTTVSTILVTPEVHDEHERVVLSEPAKAASFPGGENALSSFLNKNIQYPYNAVETPYSGKVEVEMTIEPSGEITHVHILNSPNAAIKQEINRVVTLMPKWVPAKRDNKAVATKVTVLFSFVYQGE
ncbi:MAG: energy transducer TonB [Cytophagales bacterium]|nr:energy transducer TonB [Cytophaga sp.]